MSIVSSPPSQPDVSICIANYNYGKFLKDLIPVLLRQTLSDFEIVVVDNCSTDESEAIVKSFGDPRIRFFKNEANVGMVGNWERTLSHARGRVIWMLNSDDTVEDDGFLQKVVDGMREQGAEAACVASTFEFVAEKRRRDNVLFKPRARSLTYHAALYTQILYRTGPVAGQFFFTNRPFHYDLKMKNIADYDLFLRYMVQFRPRLALLHDCKLVCRFHDQNAGVSFFQNKWRDYMGELLDIIPNNMREWAAEEGVPIGARYGEAFRLVVIDADEVDAPEIV